LFNFDLTANRAGVPDERQWVGVALGLDGGRGMGNDAAVACYLGAVLIIKLRVKFIKKVFNVYPRMDQLTWTIIGTT